MAPVLRLGRRLILPLAVLMLPPVVRADVIKAANTTNLDTGTSYVGGTPPGTGDIIIYNNTVTAANSSALGSNVNALGLQIANPGGAITIAATAGATLTLGGSGIDMSAATQDLTLNAAVVLGVPQSWNVGTRTMTIASALADNGNALNLTGTGTHRASTNNVFGTGTLNLNNNLTITSVDATARTFGNTTVNIGGNIIFGQTATGTGTLTFNGAGAVFDLGAATRTLTTNQNTTLTGVVQSSTPGVGIIKLGGGTLILNGVSTYSGTTSVNAGALNVGANLATTLPNSNVVFGAANTYLQSTVAAVSVNLGTAAGQLQFGGAFSSGFSATGTNATYTLNGGAPLTWSAVNFVQTSQSLLFGGTNGTATAILSNTLDLGAVAGPMVRTLGPTDSGAVFEGDLAGGVVGTAALIVNGTGAMRLSGSIAHQGGTFVTNGVLGYNPANLAAPANLSTGALEPIANLTASTQAGFAYTGAGAVPASFFDSLGNFGSAITVAAFSPTNNATGNYAAAVDFTQAPAALQSKLYLGAIASSVSMTAGGGATMTGLLTPAGGTYRLGGGNGTLIFSNANALTGSNNIVVRTGGVVRVNNVAQNLTGTITIDGGIFEINGAAANISSATGIIVNGVGSFANATSVNGYGSSTTFFARLRGGVLGVQNLKDATGALIGSQTVTLRGGALSAHDNDAAAGSILVQNVTADNGYTQIAHQPQAGGTGRDQLTITNLTRNPGATVEFRSQFGPLAQASGDNGNINVTNLNGVPTANTNNILGGWAVASNGGTGATNNSDATNFATNTVNGVGLYTQEFSTATTAISAAAATNNVLATGSTTNVVLANNTIAGSLTVNSLITESPVDVQAGATLAIGSGGLIMRTNANFLQSSTGNGKLTSGLASGELFLYSAGTADTRITSIAIVDNGATAVSLVKGGVNAIALGGINQSNSFTGPIIINLGTLRFDYRGSGVVLPSGAGNTVTVRSGGTFSTALQNAVPVTVPNNITLDGGTLTNENTGGGTNSTVTFSGTITVNSVAGATAFINSGAGTANSNIILGPAATLTGSGNLTKIGNQLVDIQTPNTAGFTGTIFVNTGAFQASGAGVLPKTDYYLTGGTLGITSTNQTIKNLTGTGGNILGAVGGTEALTVVQTVDAAYHGQISQTQLTKQGNAHLYLTGGGDNSSGTLQLEAGIVTLAKASTNATHVVGSASTGLVVNGGTLRLGGNFTDLGGAAPNVPPTGAPGNYVDQIYYQTDTIFNAGTFDLSGLSESFDGFDGSAPAVITNGATGTTSTLFTGQNNGGGTFAGTMQNGGGTLAYVKLGTGTQILSGNNSFTGPTEIRAGTLAVTGSLNGSIVTVKGAATLSGVGPIGGLVTEAGATVSPGVSSIASLAVSGGITLGGGSIVLTLNGTTAGVNYDQLTAGGTVSLTANTDLVLTLGFTPTAFVDNFTILDNTGAGPIGGPGLFAVGGTPLNDGDTFLLSGSQFRIQYDGGTGNDVVLETVPEPGAVAMVLGGFAMLVGIRRRRTSSES
jgi:autotransporter-associated beta strand protein